MTRSVPPEHFETLYQRSADPWDFEHSSYERAKYQDTLDHLTRPQYRHALEVGCSIGVLSGMLAKRCDHLLGVDCSQRAIERARDRHGHDPGLRFETMTVPGRFPAGSFDLILLSEILYFLDENDLKSLAGRTIDSLAPSGEILLVNWLGPTDTALSGDQAADFFVACLSSVENQRLTSRRMHYRVDRLQRAGSNVPDNP